MSIKAKLSNQFSIRWPLLFWSGAVLILIVFPFLLLEIGLKNYFEVKRQRQKDKIFTQLENKLGLLIKYRNPRHYYHALLRLLFVRAQSSNNPIAYLNKAIPHLKSKNKGFLKFIVWDKKGKTIPKLTDDKGYQYLKKVIYKTFKSVKNEVNTNYPGSISNISAISKQINLLRSYLGRFMLPSQLNYPYLKGELGKCILGSSESQKAYFWYQIDKQFGIFCTISEKAINAELPLKKIVKILNNKTKDSIKCGLVKFSNGVAMLTEGNKFLKSELLIESGKFENISQQNSETKNLLVAIKILTPALRGFAYVSKKNLLINVSRIKAIILSCCLLLLLVLATCFYYFLFKRTGIFSIKWKISILFLYANALPLMILGFIGYAYLTQKQQLLISNSQKENAKFLSSFDSQYIKTEYQVCKAINNQIDKANKKYKNNKLPISELKKIEKIALKFNPATFIAINRKAKIILSSGSKKNKSAAIFMKQMGKNFLDVVNEKVFVEQDRYGEIPISENAMSTLSKTKRILFPDILARLGSIMPDSVAAEVKLQFFQTIGSKVNRIFNYILIVAWNPDTLQEKYVNDYINDYNNNYKNIKCMAMINSNGATYPKNEFINNDIQNLFGKSRSLKLVKANNITYKGQNFIGYGIVGKKLSKVTLLALYPKDQINNLGRQIKIRLFLFALMSLCLTIAIGKAITSLLILPIKELETGVSAIKQQNFRHRLTISSEDELGNLGGMFNHALESLEDLEVARIVQENLFPQKPITQNGIEIFGKSVTMTKLGGDYYDFFNISETHTAALMGDVAGHGVPAALLMAMAKASVLISDDVDKNNPAKLLSTLHKVIFSTKSKKIRRMMTCQYFVFDSTNGDFIFSNAGHCFPALIKNQGESVELIKSIGSPLGIMKKVNYNNLSSKLNSGDILLLYTDGIVETQNKDGLAIGFERFMGMIKDAYDTNLEKYYEKIFNAYLEWGTSADDDITMMLIKFSLDTSE